MTEYGEREHGTGGSHPRRHRIRTMLRLKPLVGLMVIALMTSILAADARNPEASRDPLSLVGVTTPGPPTDVSAVPGNGQVRVTWSPPLSDGGAPILSYTVSVSPGGLTATTSSGATRAATVSGLTNGTAYTFSVHATNAVGAGQRALANVSQLGTGYWLDATDGGIFSFGTAGFYGSMGGIPLNQPMVGMAASPSGRGYWMVARDGGIFTFGDATFFGSMGGIPLNRPIVGMAATPSGRGYWLVATDGGIFSFGDAAFFGSTGAIVLNKPMVGMGATPSGNGYWMVASDGGIFSFGDAAFFGSTGAIVLNKPMVGMASTPAGNGYWMVASDGGIFSFGDAGFHGSTGAITLNQPIVGMASTPAGGGYWMVARDGGIFSFGDARFFGSMGGTVLNRPVVGMAVAPSAATVTPTGPPGLIGGLFGIASNQSLQICWEAPSDTGGTPITTYTVTFEDQAPITVDAATNCVTYGQLENGREYTFGVTAQNQTGSGETETAEATPADVPDQVAQPTAQSNAPGEATVSWVAPEDNGADITSYEVWIIDESGDVRREDVSGDQTSATFSDLNEGEEYTFRVRATNSTGTGLLSVKSDPPTLILADDPSA